MKKVLVFAAVMVLAWAGGSWAASMSNSKHDLSSGSTAAIKGDTDQICVYCHVPHHGSPGGGRPLWNHTLTTTNLAWSPAATVRGTTLPTDITSAALEGPRACLSCHDGSVALGSVIEGGPFNVTGNNTSGGALANTSDAFIDVTAMEENHPVGVQRPSAATGFTDFKTADGGTGVWYRTSSDATDYVACQSCHNPHLTTNAPFLRISNSASAICKSCHDL